MTNLNLRIDSQLKKDAESVFSQLGISSSEAVRIFFSQVRNTQSIPFELKTSYELTPSTVKAIKEAEKGLVSKPYNDTNDLMTDLLKD